MLIAVKVVSRVCRSAMKYLEFGYLKGRNHTRTSSIHVRPGCLHIASTSGGGKLLKLGRQIQSTSFQLTRIESIGSTTPSNLLTAILVG